MISPPDFAPLAAAQNWEAARISLDGLEFLRLTTPKGMADDPEVVRLKGLWENAKTAAKKLAPMLAVSDTEAMEDLQTMAPAMTALLKLTADFSDAYRTEKLRMNCADFSDQEHPLQICNKSYAPDLPRNPLRSYGSESLP